MLSRNPLLMAQVLPPFQQIEATHIEPAILGLIERNLQAVENLVASAHSPLWETVIAPLEALEDELSKAWSIVSHMNAVAQTPAWREAHGRCLAKLSEYGTRLGQHSGLYQVYLTLKGSGEFLQLSPPKQQVITLAVREFELSGVGLPPKERARFSQLSQALAEHQSQFENNVMDSTDAWHFDVQNEKELAGLPSQTITLARQVAEAAGLSKGWRLTLDFPCYDAVITYAAHRPLRQRFHEAYLTRGARAPWDNGDLINKIVEERQVLATLLGFENYAALSLAKKMIKTPEKVIHFLEDLVCQARPFAEKEWKAIQDFARDTDGVTSIAPWDMAYYSEKQCQAQFSLSQEMLRAYFPLTTALTGLFEIAARLYGIKIVEQSLRERQIQVWHENVRFFEIYDKDNHLVGMFYLDLFARSQKRGGAWMDDASCRRREVSGAIQLPVAYLVCNFRPPIAALPSLLTHEEVLTLFHEFGHGLHHLLTQMEDAAISGINGVAWDAVELPSQLMENWAWQNEALSFISSHYETSTPLPGNLLEKMQGMKHFQCGIRLLRQLEFSLFDFRLHLECDLTKGAHVQAVMEQVRQQCRVTPVAPYDRFSHSFSHIFAGEYAAGYYSYLWAEVLSQDAFSRFEEEGIFNPKTGEDFLNTLLAQGGSAEAGDLFRAFRGRDPILTPFLKERGMLQPS